jgi:hypothetical protein
MTPSLAPGDMVLGWRWRWRWALRPGSILVVKVGDRPMIKRLQSTTGSGLYVLGDNPTGSTDSRHFGAISLSAVEAIMVLKLP